MKKWMILFFLLPLLSTAQNRKESWLKIQLTHRFNEQWSAGLELQHRRQANYLESDKNIFHYPLGNYGRVWIYKQLPHQWILVLSPAGYFHNEDIINTAGLLIAINELRISPGIIKLFTAGRIENKNRFLVDIRFAAFDKPFHYIQFRYRMQNSFTFPVYRFPKKTSISYYLSNEYMLRSNNGTLSFDQIRINNAVRWKWNRTTADMGYQFVVQKGNTKCFRRGQLCVGINVTI